MTQYDKVIKPSNPANVSSETKEVVAQAIGSSGYTTDDAAAKRASPEIWDDQLRRFVQTDFDIQSRAEVERGLLGEAGDTLNVTVDKVPSAASSVAETDDVSIQELDNRQVTYEPTEYATAFQVHDKTMRRNFFDVMANASQKIGYALRLIRERTAISTVESGADTTYGVGTGVGAADSDISSSDTLTYDALVDARRELKKENFGADRVYVTPKQFSDLAKLDAFQRVDQSGSDETLRGGDIGRIFGMTVYEHNELTVDGSSPEVHHALILGSTDFGDGAFGFCPKKEAGVRTEREELGRYTNIVGVEEWDMEMLRPKAAVEVLSA